MQRWACFTFWCYVKTSCCSSDSEKPHRHCHLSNKVDTLTGDLIFPILTMSWEMSPPKLPFSLGIWAPGFLGPNRVHNAGSISIDPFVFAQVMGQQTHDHAISATVKYTDIAVRSLTCLTAAGTHMPYGITQCYLPPDRGDVPALTPAEAGTRLSDPGGMQG